jgi:transcriptional regulator with XRE-family HTH domain
MDIKTYLKKKNLTLRQMAEICDVHYSTLYRLSIPKDHKSARRVSLEIALKIEKGTKGLVSQLDLLGTPSELR